MRVLLVEHESSLRHDTGRGHPERPSRIPAVIDGVHASGLDVVPHQAPVVDLELVARVHEPRYIREIEQFCAGGGGALDPDTVAVADSWEAALRAAGAGPAAVAGLRAGIADTAFLAVRPPGHHALIGRAMGFCLFNNIAVTARMLTEGGERVAILDWDVHHGNGTQDTFYRDPNVLYVSLHEFPAYPGTGWVDEDGAGDAEGTVVNFPMPMGTQGDAYRWAMRWVILDVMRDFAPDWILVSAGYDAHRADPLAGIRLVESDYGVMAHLLTDVVPAHRVVFFLEGGYDLAAMTASVAATLRGVAGDSEEFPRADEIGTGGAWRTVMHVAGRLGGP
ncbi:MAG: histone deacetylase [Acidimicrobiia bacterium]|nr:histone deacetylase [Acidimicrobiia bacterium]